MVSKGARSPVDTSTVERRLRARSPAELEEIAAAVSSSFVPGDRVALFGELGAGKTVFARGVARGLGHPDPRDVVSPTFAIHNRHPRGRIPLDHLDLYRLPAPVSLAREGLDTVVADRGSVLLCEWAERLGEPLPGLVLEVHLHLESETAR